MKETGIIMSGNHPKLILDGIKTMTRRVIKPQPQPLESGQLFWKHRHQDIEIDPNCHKKPKDLIPFCPYGQVSDRLWVRETHFIGGIEAREWVAYQADGGYNDNAVAWQPSIHMFRKDSRITLEILEIRAERVQDITSWDCIAEGISQKYNSGRYFELYGMATDKPNHCLIEEYKDLWDSLNAKRGYGWNINPWVWVISFRRIEP